MQVEAAWQLAFARGPRPSELQEALRFLAAQAPSVPAEPAQTAGANPQPAPGEAPVDALASLCQVLLSSNEFLYVD
jgi:hypothetical protein